MSLYFSRLTLNRYAPTRALSGLLDPADDNARADAHHRLIWTLFGDARDRPRDFLWRADGRGRFFILSARPPLANDLFCPPETKEFAPQLAPPATGCCFRCAPTPPATGRRSAGWRNPPAGARAAASTW
ncbi:type I-E CRISPR-associated protein Cas6/Cse3/CasE [Jhaorihella thermophila]